MKITRRLFAFLLVLAAPVFLLPSVWAQEKSEAPRKYLAYIGTYTTKTQSKGIYAYRFDGATGKLSAMGVAAESADPSFLTVHPGGAPMRSTGKPASSRC